MIPRRRPITPEQALIKLEELCARAEHSEGELREKLRKWAIPSSTAQRIIDSLRSRRFVDDSRFAACYVRDKVRFDRWGRLKIRQGLRAKGISSDDATKALDLIDNELYRHNLQQLLKAKARTIAPDTDPYTRRAKLLRFALSRGYEAQMAYTCLNRIIDSPPGEL